MNLQRPAAAVQSTATLRHVWSRWTSSPSWECPGVTIGTKCGDAEQRRVSLVLKIGFNTLT